MLSRFTPFLPGRVGCIPYLSPLKAIPKRTRVFFPYYTTSSSRRSLISARQINLTPAFLQKIPQRVSGLNIYSHKYDGLATVRKVTRRIRNITLGVLGISTGTVIVLLAWNKEFREKCYLTCAGLFRSSVTILTWYEVQNPFLNHSFPIYTFFFNRVLLQ